MVVLGGGGVKQSLLFNAYQLTMAYLLLSAGMTSIVLVALLVVGLLRVLFEGVEAYCGAGIVVLLLLLLPPLLLLLLLLLFRVVVVVGVGQLEASIPAPRGLKGVPGCVTNFSLGWC